MRLHSLSANRYVWVAILAAVSARLAPSQDVPFGPITVPATAVIFDPDNVLAPNQLAALRSAGPLNPVSAVKALTFAPAAGQTIVFVASGAIGCCGVAQVGPDGYVGSAENISGIGSISGFDSPNGLPLVGVFTNGNPTGGAPPDYSYSGGVNQLSFSPVLNQVFFIGDGLTGNKSGPQQIFNVPPTATEVWLGFVDGGTFRGPPQNYGDNAGSLQVGGTLSTTNCAQQADINPDKVSIVPNPQLTSNAGLSNPKEKPGYLFVYTGVRTSGDTSKPASFFCHLIPSSVSGLFSGPGICVDMRSAITAKGGGALPDGITIVQVQNLVRYHGNAVYGEGAGARTEYPAAVANGYSTPLFDGVYNPFLEDSPDISVPLVDAAGLPLTQVCYEKDFKTYIGCYTGTPGRFHAMAAYTWQAHFCGTVKANIVPGSQPTSASAEFTSGTKNAVTYQGAVKLDQEQNPVYMPSACATSFVDFKGNIPLPPNCK